MHRFNITINGIYDNQSIYDALSSLTNQSERKSANSFRKLMWMTRARDSRNLEV